jgi:hypothetical protein
MTSMYGAVSMGQKSESPPNEAFTRPIASASRPGPVHSAASAALTNTRTDKLPKLLPAKCTTREPRIAPVGVWVGVYCSALLSHIKSHRASTRDYMRAGCEDRTHHLMITNQVLYQLS